MGLMSGGVSMRTSLIVLATAGFVGAIACVPQAMPNAAGLDMRSEPVIGGQAFPNGMASHPSVLQVPGGLLIAYTCLDDAGETTAICMARSGNGVDWRAARATVADRRRGTVIVASGGDTHLESPALVLDGDSVLVYASVHGAVADPAPGFPARLVRFRADLNDLEFSSPQEVLSPEPETGSCSAVYSPTIRPTDLGFEMLFAGHCYDAEQPEEAVNGLTVLRTTSTDGLSWAPAEPALSFDPGAHPLFIGGIAEPSFIAGIDDVILVSAGFDEASQQHTLVARLEDDGRYTVDPTPLLAPRSGYDGCGAFAPDARVVDDELLIWYLAQSCEGQFNVGHASGDPAILDAE
ncbi:MAG: putative GH43/DUF377 family glycosyl hydrolase [Myxococcota bacterium]|jgi:predicted GH43/DUF377 family glycosyl hydrolase